VRLAPYPLMAKKRLLAAFKLPNLPWLLSKQKSCLEAVYGASRSSSERGLR
jgi:hypothetical protein